MEQINRIRKKPLSDHELQIVRQMEADSKLGNQPADLALDTAIQNEGAALALILDQALPVVNDLADLEENIAAVKAQFPDAIVSGRVLETRAGVQGDGTPDMSGAGENVKLHVETEITIECDSGKVVLKVTPPGFPELPQVTTQVLV